MATTGSEDYYGLLGVSPGASFEEIREGYRKQALRCHPDKNRHVDTTEQFQRLSRAWEVLQDRNRRKEYDAEFVRIRRHEVDLDALRRWEAARQQPCSAEEKARIERAKEWRLELRTKFQSRLQAWEDFQGRQITAIQHYSVLVRRYEKQLDDQLRESEETMFEKFTAAISLTESNGQQLEDHGLVMSKLMEARRVYLLNLRLAAQASKGRLEYLLQEYTEARRKLEDEEYSDRQTVAEKALEILESRNRATPLFNVIDRRRQSINYWRGLARVRPALSLPIAQSIESPWHAEGQWTRIPGEHSCGRCLKSAFHIISGCGAARCPGCGMVVCNNCHRDLELLREFQAWILSPQDRYTSLFSLEFEEGSGPISSWDDEGIGRCWV